MSDMRRPVRFLALAAAASLGLALVGCAAPTTPSQTRDGSGGASGSSTSDDHKAGSEGAANRGTAVMRVDSREFTFTLELCSVTEDDVLLAGSGMGTGSETPGWLEGDLVAVGGEYSGEFRVDVGTDRRFTTTDNFYTLGDSLGGPLAHTESGDGHTFRGSTWNELGTDLGQGEITFACS